MRKHVRRNANADPTLAAGLEALKTSIARYAETEGSTETDVPGLFVVRYDAPTKPKAALYEPCVCVAAQGAKHVVLGGDSFTYAPGNFLISSVNLPTTARITKASREKPFLGVVLKLDPRESSIRGRSLS
jgi:hypothetical protein